MENGDRIPGLLLASEPELRELGIDERCLRVEWISASEGQKFAKVTSEFTMIDSSLPPKRGRPRVAFCDTVMTLAQAGLTDYSIVGWSARAGRIEPLMCAATKDLLLFGSLHGAGGRTRYDNCPGSRRQRCLRHFYHRPWEDLAYEE